MNRRTALVVAVVGAASSVSLAATKTWVGGAPGGQYFDVSGNWTPSGAPGSFDLARFTLGSTYNVLWDDTTNNTTNTGLEVLGGNVTFRVDAGLPRTHTVTDFIVNAGRLNLVNQFTLRATSTGFVDITNGGRLDVNAGTTFDAPFARLDLGFSSNATENLLVVVDGVVNTRESYIGESAGTNGRATINGANGRWNLTDDLVVGGAGHGVLEVTTGAKVSNRNGFVGFSAGSSGTATITGTGSVWTNTGTLALGRPDGTSTGALTISANGRVNVGDTAASNNVGGFSFIEDASPDPSDGGVLSVFAGSTLTNNNTGNAGLSIGRGVGRHGSVLVSGAGATINDNLTFVGYQGTGTLTVNAGGKHIANSAEFATGGGTATVTVDGAGSLLWSKGDLSMGSGTFGGNADIDLTNGGDLRVGDATNDDPAYDVYVSDLSPIGTAGGVLTIANGSTLDSPLNTSIATFSGQSGRVIVNGTNSRWTTGFQMEIAYGSGSTGDLRIEAGGLARSNTNVLIGRGGTGTASVSGAGRLESGGNTSIGMDAGSVGTATIAGTNSSLAVGGQLQIGINGTGTLNINTGGKATAPNATLGVNATGVGTINLTGAGSLLDVEGDLTIGNLGRGIVNGGQGILVGDAATVSGDLDISDSNVAGNAGGNVVLNNNSTWAMNNVVRIAVSANTYGRLAVNSGSTFSTNSAIDLGTTGTGKLDVNTGGRVTLNSSGGGTELNIGFLNGSSGTVTIDGSGSMIDVNSSVRIAVVAGSAGNLTIRNNGRLAVGNVADLNAADGLLLLSDSRANGPGGKLTINAGGTLDHNGTVSIGPDLSGGQFGQLTLTGGASAIANVNGLVQVGRFGSLNVASGTFTVLGAANGVSVANGGRVNITGGDLRVPTLDFSFAGSAGVSMTNGRLTVDTVNAGLANTFTQSGGTNGPGGFGARKDMTIVGNYVLSGGNIEADLFGINGGFLTPDGINVIGNLTLSGGSLILHNVNFDPNNSGESLFIGASSRTGVFSSVSGAALSPTRYVAVLYSPATVFIKMARPGDANVDGTVAFDDLLILAQNYSDTITGRHWALGDFNGNGKTNFDDLLLLTQNYGLSGMGLPTTLGEGFSAEFAADWAMALSLAPEPGSIMSLLACAAVVRRRR